MFERLRRVVVESFVGTVALGYLLAQCILEFVSIFSSPIQEWVVRKEYREFAPSPARLTGFPFDYALPGLAKFVPLLLVWYLLLRWLYFKPLKHETTAPAPNPEQPS